MPSPRMIAFALTFLLGCGCTSLSGSANGDAPSEGHGFARSKTLLSWSAGREPEPKKPDAEGKNGTEAASPEPEKPDSIVTDRPDFTEASSTVGKGRIQLEAGYTFIRDRSGGVTTTSHSYPEALFRIGALADWLEFRLGQNFGNTRTGAPLGGGF